MARTGAENTRSSVSSHLFGAPWELKELQLPAYADTMRHYYWLQKENHDVYFQPVDDHVKMVGDTVLAIWTKASLPVVSKRTIYGKMKDY